MQFWASFGTSFLYYTRKWGGVSPSPESGGPIPLSLPCSDAYGPNYKIRRSVGPKRDYIATMAWEHRTEQPPMLVS